MAQIIKHRRGSLEALSAVTSSLQKGELVIASGSSNLTVTNGSSLVFVVPADGQVQATNRFLIGDAAPNTFAGSTYNGMVKGVPYYASGSSTLYLLGTDGNEAINLVGNIQPFSSSVASSINALSASIGGGTIGNSVNLLNSKTGSYATTGSNVFVETQTITGSLNIKDSAATFSIVGNGFSETYLQGNGAIVLQAGGSGVQIKSNNLEVQGTISGTTISGSSIAGLGNATQFSTSVDSRLDAVEASLGSGGDIGIKVSALETSSVNLNAFSASALTRLSNLESKSASVDVSISDINSYTSSLRTALTASGANVTFSGNVTIPGNLTVSGTQTIVDSTTVQIGDNIIELNGSGAANGGLWVKDATNPNNATGSIIWDSTNDYWKAGVKGSESKVALMGGDNVVTASAQILLTGVQGYDTFSSSIATNVVELFGTASNHEGRIDTIEASIGGGGSLGTRVASLETFSGSQESKDSTLATYTASVDSRLGQLETNSGSQASQLSNLQSFSGSQETKNSTLATYTASVDSHISNVNTYTASNDTTNSAQNARLTTLEAFTGSQETKDSNLSTYTASVDSRLNQLSTNSGSQASQLSNLELFSGSQNTKNSTLATYTASIDVNIANIHTFTSSFGTTFSSSVDSRLDTLEGTGTIQGVGTGNNVTFAKVTTTGDVVVGGDLVVQGNTVSLNTATLTIEDKLITLASGSTSSATADGAGIEIAGAGANFIYQHSTTAFTSSVALIAPSVTASVNLGTTAGSTKRIAFRNTNGNLDLVATASVAGDLLQWNGTDFVMSNTVDGGSF
jgi:hypothetical protein